jgi:hypothetical protein
MKANSATLKASFDALRETPSADEVCGGLTRVLRSPAFRDSLRLASFLKFVVEAALGGKGDRIKSYTIAVEALGRGPAFDPQTDPIVRVEAGRLRNALARYYATTGCDDAILIDMPRGTYVPVFTWRDEGAAPQPSGRGGIEEGIAPAARSESVTDQRGKLSDTIAAFRALAALHRLQIAAVNIEIANARRTLESSHALLQLAAERLAGDMGGTTARHPDTRAAKSPALPGAPTRPSDSSGSASAESSPMQSGRGSASVAAGRATGRQASAVPTRAACRRCFYRRP